jgi:methylenetetrahydrofolate--tRNA-(uracil-5-)-methyltransferase
MDELTIIGGGLAGSEAAWQAAERGIQVKLFEMRPGHQTPAHKTKWLAELVCSNSLGSKNPQNASGLLKQELNLLGSMLLNCAEKNKLPAGSSLSVDREDFSKEVTKTIENHPNIEILHKEIKEIPPSPCIIASGPLTSEKLTRNIQIFTGQENLYFYDAIAPVLEKDGIDLSIAFYGSRYGIGANKNGDYINCPMNKKEYTFFVSELVSARKIEVKEFEKTRDYFEACLPIEVLAARHPLALAFGPLKPIGITNSHMDEKPYALVQLRQDNYSGSLFNMVGFQTNLAFSEQERIFRMIPGLENAKFSQYGQMHRNTYVRSPMILLSTLQTKRNSNLYFAGQISGVEGYLGSIASGLVAGINAARMIKGDATLTFPIHTMIGALCNYLSLADADHFQPMKANFGLLTDVDCSHNSKKVRSQQKYQRALEELRIFIMNNHI